MAKTILCIALIAIFIVVANCDEPEQESDETRAVRAAVKLPVNCKETKYKGMCKFYKKVVPMYENVEIWRLKDQTPTVTFYGIRDQVVDDVPIWILPKEEWEVIFTDAGLKMKPEYAVTSTTTTTPAPQKQAKVKVGADEEELPVKFLPKQEL